MSALLSGVAGCEVSKVFKLKEWVTVPDAAKRLSITFGESVSESDVFRFALDGHLRLSVHLVNGAYARPCRVIDTSKIEWEEVPDLMGPGTVRVPKKGRIIQIDNLFLQTQESISRLSGVWELPLKGGERVDVEHAYQVLENGPEVTAISLEGVLVSNDEAGIFELQDRIDQRKIAFDIYSQRTFAKELNPANFHPSGALPDDSVFVVRTKALVDFELAQIDESSKSEKPLGTTERNQLLKMVLGMAIDSYGHDPTALKNEATAQIVDDLAKIGISITSDTVRKYLKEAASTVTYQIPKPK